MENNRDDKNIVVVGSCSVDFTAYSSRLPEPGETLIGTKFTTSFGGKGANQCVAAAKLGAKVSFICKLGDDQWGLSYREYLAQNEIDVSNIKLIPNISTGIAQISVSSNGENQIVIVPGANSHLSIDDIKKSKILIENASVLVGQLETPFNVTLEAFKLNKGLRILNAAPAIGGIDKIFPYCSILCVNETEASLLTNLNVNNVTNAVPALEKLLQHGCETVIITLGKNGAVYSSASEQQAIHVPCPDVTAVDTTGAGDAFVGALATLLLSRQNEPLHQIIGAACEVSTDSVTREGTQTSYSTNIELKEYSYTIL